MRTLLRKGQKIIARGIKGIKELVFQILGSDIFIGIISGMIYLPTYRHGPKRYFKIKDILTAIRQCDHILEKYLGEKGLSPERIAELLATTGFTKGEVFELTELIKEIKNLIKKLDQKLAPAEKQAVRSKFLAIAAKLTNKYDRYKTRAEARLLEAAQSSNIKDQKNAAASAHRSLKKRIELIFTIAPCMGRRKMILEAEVSHIESELKKILETSFRIEREAINKRVALALRVPKLISPFLLSVEPYRSLLTTAFFHFSRAICAKDEKKTEKALGLAIDRIGEAITLSHYKT